MQLTRWILIAAHVLAGGAWFGAMLYSLMVLHPRARSFFGNSRQFEEFIAHLAAGARWKVLSGVTFIALTGIGLLLVPGDEPSSRGRIACLFAKTALFAIAVSIFCFASWRLWPARTLASVEELPKFQQTFRRIAVALLVLVGLCMALGVLSSHL
jgi:putative copper export protein